MKKKIVLISIIIAIIIVSAVFLYSTYADPEVLNDSYPITLTGNTTVTVPAGSMKKIIYQIKSNNSGTVNYGIGYSSQSNDVAVKAYSNSADAASGTIASNSYKNVTLAVINNSSASATITLSTILGYENGGNLIVPSGTTLVTQEVHIAADYITNLYTNDTNKSTATVNSITYNLAPSVNLMDDRLASSSTPADTVGNIRYYGASPNNYVWLGDTYTTSYTIPGNITLGGYTDQADCIQDGNSAAYCTEDIVRHTGDKKLWRVIGVFGGKVKVVSADPISTQDLSWDTSANEAGGNSGYGINQWGPSGSYEGSDLMRLLNPGYEGTSINNSLYWNKTAGTVYTSNNNRTTSNVSFANTGLSSSEKALIDTATWYTGAYDSVSYVDAHYAAERGTTGKICSSGTSECDDIVVRTNTWSGKVGLIYASDYGYAANLAQCNQTLNEYYNTGCVDTNWLKQSSWGNWTMSPHANSGYAYIAFSVDNYGILHDVNACSGYWVWPAIYLKPNVIIDTNSNDGSEQYPYVLMLN